MGWAFWQNRGALGKIGKIWMIRKKNTKKYDNLWMIRKFGLENWQNVAPRKTYLFLHSKMLDGFSGKSQDFISNSALKWAVDHPKANENLGCRKSGWEPPFSRKYRIIGLGTDNILVYNHNETM